MAAYIVSTVRIHDAEKVGAYVQALTGVVDRFGGEYLLRGKVAEVFEGDVDPDERVVVVRFADAEAARTYITSPDYRAAAAHRAGAADVEIRLLVDPA